jgi:hypothetical protein
LNVGVVLRLAGLDYQKDRSSKQAAAAAVHRQPVESYPAKTMPSFFEQYTRE